MSEARILFGRADTVEADYLLTDEATTYTAETGTPVVRVWQPHRQVAFGIRDTNEDGYERARRTARARGYHPIERRVGGRAVAYTGSTVAFAHCRPVDDVREGLQHRYDDAVAALRSALSDVGVEAERGEPEQSFCPGAHSLQADGKIAGIAQRVSDGAAIVSGIVILCDHDEIAATLAEIYADLGIEFDPETVGSIERTCGSADFCGLRRTIAESLTGSVGIDPVDVYDLDWTNAGAPVLRTD